MMNMKQNVTELVFIIDKSGSMAGLEADTIGGYNAMLTKQKGETGEVAVTTVLFNHALKFLHDRMNIIEIEPITEKEYEVGGTTALLDAIGSTIHKISTTQKSKSVKDINGKVLVVITTDGMENSSKEYTLNMVNAMIAQQKEKHDWDFIFLGANIDAISTAERFGIHKDFAVEYHADNEGTKLNFEVLNEAVTSFRQSKKIDRSWKEDIEKDYESRQK